MAEIDGITGIDGMAEIDGIFSVVGNRILIDQGNISP